MTSTIHYSQIVKDFERIDSVQHKNFKVLVQGIKNSELTQETYTYKFIAVAKTVAKLLSQFKGIK